MVENETSLKIKKLRSNNGGEYEDNEFKKFLLPERDKAHKDGARYTAAEWYCRTYEHDID